MGVLGLTACQSAGGNAQVKNLALNQDKRMGVIQSLGGAHVSSQATHLLRLDDGKTLFLKSALMDLGSPKYAAKEVEVAGSILRTTDGNELMDVMNIDLIDRDTSVIPTIPQWVNYSQPQLQIGLRYRDDYKLQEDQDSLTLTKIPKPSQPDDGLAVSAIANASGKSGTASISPKNEAIISVKVISRDINYNLLEYLGVVSDSASDLLSKGLVKSKITQKALDSYKSAKSDGTEVSYFVKSGFTYQLKFTAGDSSTQVIDQNLFYDVLASVNFGTDAVK